MKFPQGRQAVTEAAGFMNWPDGQGFIHNALKIQLVCKGDWTVLKLELVIVPQSTKYKLTEGLATSPFIAILLNHMIKFQNIGLYSGTIPRFSVMEYEF
jgi:hypothetical protein